MGVIIVQFTIEMVMYNWLTIEMVMYNWLTIDIFDMNNKIDI